MRVWTRRLLVVGAAAGALAAGACGLTDRAPGSEPSGDVSEIGTGGTSDCPGKPAAAPRPQRSWATEEVVLDGDMFVVRMPHNWSLLDEGDGRGDAYALVPDDSAVAVALAGGNAAVEVREVAEFAAAVSASTRRSPTSFASGRGCRLSVEGEGGDDRYEVWLADGGDAVAAIAGGPPDEAATWREAEAIVASIEKADA